MKHLICSGMHKVFLTHVAGSDLRCADLSEKVTVIAFIISLSINVSTQIETLILHTFHQRVLEEHALVLLIYSTGLFVYLYGP